MFRSDIEICEGAFFIADAHFSDTRVELFEFINSIHLKKFNPTQLILFGDIFDALFGGVTYTIKKNQKIIDMLNDISDEIEVIYLEGNHDFNLTKLFPKMKVFTIDKQPVLCSYKGKKVLISHGDFDSPLGYKIYTFLIRNRYILPILNIINNLTSNSILKNLNKHLSKKDDCKEFVGFKKYMNKRLGGSYDCDYFIDAHYHQNHSLNIDDFNYINLGAFACNQRYFIVKFAKEKLFLEENVFSKEIKYG